ncbi:MAG TPA: hypothetical protein VH107_11060 [Lacipirellulaceae bacterium]|nr:hypothetical protein [Lacipirellulaceae bacterium]
MYVANRILGLIAMAAVVGSCEVAEAQVIRGGPNGGGKPCPTSPAVGRQPAAVGRLPVLPGGVGSRQPKLNAGSGNAGGNGRGAGKRLAASRQAPGFVQPRSAGEEKQHGEHRKKQKEQGDEAQVERVKLKPKKRRRHEEIVEGTRVVGEERVGGTRVVGDDDVFVTGPRYFATNSVWEGKRENGADQWAMRLVVNEFDGNLFKGVLSQRTSAGDLERTKVEGEVDGDTLAFSTTRALGGKKQHLSFDGCVSENEMQTKVSDLGEAIGTMELVRKGADVVAP